MLKWKTGYLPTDESALVQIGTDDDVDGPDYFLAYINDNGILCFLDSGDDTGWTVEEVTRWIALQDILEAAV